LYDHLFKSAFPEDVPEGQDWRVNLNPSSLEVVEARLEPSLNGAQPGERFQFERLGYFTVDKDSSPAKLRFNRTVTLKDTWAKEEKKGKPAATK
jgi:glutaminyl-tRNA synthetase